MSNLQRINQDLWINAAGYCNRIDPTNINERHLTAGTQNVIIENLDAQTTRVMTRYGYKSCSFIEQPAVTPANVDYKFAGSYTWNNTTDIYYYTAFMWRNGAGVNLKIKRSLNDICGTYDTVFNNAYIPATGSRYKEAVRFATWDESGSCNNTILAVYGTDRIAYQDYTMSFMSDILLPMLYGNGTDVHTTGPLAGQPIGKSPVEPPSTYTIDYIRVFEGQLFIGSRNSRYIYVSRVADNLNSTCFDWANFEYSDPNRLAGEGGILKLNSNCRGFGIESNNLQIYTENDHVYDLVKDDLGSGLQDIYVKPKKISSGQGAYEQELITEIKNGTIYLTNERTVDILSQVENFTNTQSTPISDIVQIDIDNMELTDARMFYHKRNLYLMFPKSSTTMIYNLERGIWQPPQTMSIAGMTTEKDVLYGYEYISDDKDGIKVFRMDCYNGYNKENIDLSLTDDGAGYICRIVTPYTHLGVRHHKKFHNSIFVEGYISANSIINVKCLKDYGGYGGIQEKDIHGVRQEGDKVKFINDPVDTVSLGKSVLGSHSLGNDNPYLIPKFHHVLTFSEKNSYYERQIQFEGEQLEQRWGIISYSTNAGMSSDTNFDVTK